jgi:hypothetical protein
VILSQSIAIIDSDTAERTIGDSDSDLPPESVADSGSDTSKVSPIVSLRMAIIDINNPD